MNDHVENCYEADKKRSACKYYYYRLVNPWIRFLLILPILYLYLVSASVLTYRNNIFEKNVQSILAVKQPVPGSKPLVEAYSLGWVILYDLGFDAIPPATPETYPHWKFFADFSSAFFNVILIILVIIRWDSIRLFEYAWCQMVMFALNGLVHVLTSLPDSGGVQSACHDPKYYQSGVHSWFWSTFTFIFCGDMMWSGHTVNTLLPMIMIRRLAWDIFGWHFSYHDVEEPTPQKRNEAASRSDAMRQQQLRDLQLLLQYSTFNVHYDSTQAFAQFVAMAHERAQENYNPETYSKQAMAKRDWLGRSKEPATIASGITLNGSAAANSVPVPAEAEADETARLNQSSYQEAVSNIQKRNLLTTAHYFEVAKTNPDNDLLLRKMKSPFVTPLWAARHRKFWWILLFIIRCLAPIYFGFFVAAIILIRYHYTADVVVAILACLAISFNPPLSQGAIRFLYRPYYHNYLVKHWWAPVYPSYPLNEEQVNFEERIRMVGYGGLF